MKHLISTALLLLCISTSIYAQNQQEKLPQLVQQITDFKPLPISNEHLNSSNEITAPKPYLDLEPGKSWFKISDDTVGDAYSFNKRVKWAGVADAALNFSANCQGASSTTNNRCLPNSVDNSNQSFDEKNLDRIVLPPKTAYSLMCHSISPILRFDYRNQGTTQNNKVLYFTPYVTVTNSALDDPSLINPYTGQPYSGSFETSFGATVYEMRTLQPGEIETDHKSYSRNCIGGFISRKALETQGLPKSIVNQFFNRKTTIDLHVRGAHNLVENGFLYVGFRILTDEYPKILFPRK